MCWWAVCEYNLFIISGFNFFAVYFDMIVLNLNCKNELRDKPSEWRRGGQSSLQQRCSLVKLKLFKKNINQMWEKLKGSNMKSKNWWTTMKMQRTHTLNWRNWFSCMKMQMQHMTFRLFWLKNRKLKVAVLSLWEDIKHIFHRRWNRDNREQGHSETGPFLQTGKISAELPIATNHTWPEETPVESKENITLWILDKTFLPPIQTLRQLWM